MTEFPKKIQLRDGVELELRRMTADDRDPMLRFASALAEEDLLFLRVDLTNPAAVDDWIANIEAGNSTSLVAYLDAELIGYATVHRNAARWTRGVGEIRLNVAPAYRGRGLGRILAGEIFDVAHALGLRKLMANMTAEQRGAQAAFGRLGFFAEALLSDFVEDKTGASHDMVVMSCTVDGQRDKATG